MSLRSCTMDGCDRPHYGRGWCKPHYLRWYRGGDPAGERAMRGDLEKFLRATIAAGPQSECVIWPFGENGQGYGQAYVNGEPVLAHRYVCEQFRGPPPTDEHDAAHRCGTRLCINPDCLRWATREENMADTIAHGTRLIGEANPTAKLMADEVKAIASNPNGLTQDALAAQFGVSRGTISDIQCGRTWSHLTEKTDA